MRPRLPRFSPSIFGFGLAGAVLLWAAMPPLDLWPLAWIAPAPWVWLVRKSQLDDRRPYLALWVAGFCFWMATLQWLRLPHPATSIGWVAMSFYFAFYLPLFVGLSRTAVHRLRMPVILAAPIVWTGLELVRAHLFTGMTMGSLCYTQYHWISLIQISDLTGMYGVSFVVMFAAASLARMIPCEERGWTFWPLLPAAGIIVVVLGYGQLQLCYSLAEKGPKIALIQGSIDIDMRHDPGRKDRVMQEYFDLSFRAAREHPDVDLIVWPETMFLDPLLIYDSDAAKPPNLDCSDEEFFRRLERAAVDSRLAIKRAAQAIGAPLLLGIDRYHITADGEKVFNSSVNVARDGTVLDHYDKMHLVMFGEYVPFADRFPWLQGLTPLPLSITAGDRPAAFEVGQFRLSPNICYETVLPHVIRRQVNQLSDEDREPDILVNLTNDGWFWGSSELDMHLICGVFRAVECRKPLLIAANTGFSAWIDSDGCIQKQGPRQEREIIFCQPSIVIDRKSWYLKLGDWFAGLCLFGTILCVFIGIFRKKPPKQAG